MANKALDDAAEILSGPVGYLFVGLVVVGIVYFAVNDVASGIRTELQNANPFNGPSDGESVWDYFFGSN